MRSIILCEGFDEILIIGYYLYKTKGWLYQKDGSFSQLYSFPKLHKRNQLIEVYKKNNDLLAIWCVGGKDSFELAFKFIKKTNFNHPEKITHCSTGCGGCHGKILDAISEIMDK